MKRKIFVVLMALIAVICCVFGFGACGTDSNNTTNNANNANDANINEDGTVTHTHTFSSSWQYNETYHWHAATCGHMSEVSEKSQHTLSNNKCTVCGYMKQSISSHEHNYKTSITSPTCIARGYTTYTCSCGDTYIDDYIDALGHNYVDHEAKAVTCMEIGYNAYQTCSRCDYSTYEEIPALGHNYLASGYCNNCGELNPAYAVSVIEVTNASNLLTIGANIQLTYKILPENAKYDTVKFEINEKSNTCGATITSTGLLSCTKAGQVVVRISVDNISTQTTFYVAQKISTAEEFYNIRNNLNGYYILNNDIDLSEYSCWTPIGFATQNPNGGLDATNAFKGQLDGSDYTITGLHIELENIDLITAGLFGCVDSAAIIANLNIKNATINGAANSSTNYIGTLTAINYGRINNCSVNAQVDVNKAIYVGGIVGDNTGYLNNVNFEGSVTAQSTNINGYYIGGIAGNLRTGQINEATVTAMLTVTSGNYAYVGGVAGNSTISLTGIKAETEINLTISNSGSNYSYIGGVVGNGTDVTKSSTSGEINLNSRANCYVGGIAGYATSLAEIESEVLLAVTINNTGYIGGVAGYITDNVEDCKNVSDITIDSVSDAHIGGVSGYIGGNAGNCTNYGKINANVVNFAYLGGVAGKIAGTAKECVNTDDIYASVSFGYVGGVIGCIDGRSTQISNNSTLLTVVISSVNSLEGNYIGGVVGYGNDIEVAENKAVINTTLKSNGYVGGIVGYSKGVLNNLTNNISEIVVSFGSSRTSYVGGVVGYAEENVKKADNKADIVASNAYSLYLGGIAGYIAETVEDAVNVGLISVKYVTGNSNSNGNHIGGIAGYANGAISVKNQANAITVTSARGALNVGGAIGDGTSIKNSYSLANITADSVGTIYIGGLVGEVSGLVTDIAINTSYSIGKITAKATGSGAALYAGGLAGFGAGSIAQCYSECDVEAICNGTLNVGGLIGKFEKGDLKDSYATHGIIDVDIATMGNTAYVGGLVGYSSVASGSIFSPSLKTSIESCYSINFISCNADGSGDNMYVGGLVGYNVGSISKSYTLSATDTYIRADYTFGDVTCTSINNATIYVGGIAGYISGTVSDCYSKANLVGNSCHVGGFVGSSSVSANISTSIAYGKVNNGISSGMVYGFSASSEKTGYSDCYFSTTGTMITADNGITGVKGVSGNELTQSSAFSAFSSSVWEIKNGNYPDLISDDNWKVYNDGFDNFNVLVNVIDPDRQMQFADMFYTITYVTNSESEISDRKAVKQSTIFLPSPEKEGHVFVCWCSDEELTTPVDGVYTVTGSVTLYAKFNKIVEYPEEVVYTFNTEEYSVEETDYYTVSGTLKATDAGEYSVTFKLKDGYCWQDGSTDDYSIIWTINVLVLEVPEYVRSEYTGEEINLADTYKPEIYIITGTDKATELGDYQITLSLLDTQNCVWSDGTYGQKTYTWQIISGTIGDNLVWGLNNSGSLKIWGEGDMPSYSSASAYGWNSRRNKVLCIEVSDTVTSIGGYAFYNCSSLTSITIGNGVTSIGWYAFEKCSSLTSITIPDSVTSIGNGAFYNCSSLTNITVAEGNSLYHSAGNCLIETKSKTLIVGCKNSVISADGSVKSIGSFAFYGCSGLTSITIPDSVTSIGSGVFSGCSGLESITLPFAGGSIKTSSATYQYPLGYIFGTSSYTGGVATTQGYYSSSTSIMKSDTYYLPESLKEVTITGGDILFGAFSPCSSLTSVTIGNGVTSIGGYAFSSCSSLTSVTIGDGVKSIDQYAFIDCSSLTSIAIPDSVTSIGSAAFYSCSSLKSVTIGDGVKSIDQYAFKNCSSLTSVTIGNGVTSINGYAFENCSSLTSITIPDSVTSISSYSFNNCSSLTSVAIGDGVKSIAQHAFKNCSSLTSVTFKNTSGWRVSTSSSATSGTSVTVTNSYTAATYLKSTYENYYWKRS